MMLGWLGLTDKFLFMRIFVLCLSLASFFLLAQCDIKSHRGIVIQEEPYEYLSEFNFFKGAMADLSPVDGVLPYDLNTPLFSDYAEKARFVWVPEGQSANYTIEHVIDFPKGTVLIKNFFYNHDDRDISLGRKIVETRLLINHGDEWKALGYIWNEDQTDAKYEIIGGIKDISWIDESGDTQNINYIIPNKNQCKNCHAYKGVQKPIGPKVRNLNKDFTYIDGNKNQLLKWHESGILNGYNANDNHPAVVVWDDTSNSLQNRTMAYLDMNCGHCHNPDGAANTSGLTLTYESPMDTNLGIYKPTVSAGAGTGGHTYSIVPRHPEESIMIYRMKSLNPGAMMPELGRSTIHEEGVALISEWIEKMDESSLPNKPNRSLQ